MLVIILKDQTLLLLPLDLTMGILKYKTKGIQITKT